jgi:hypothetical protein
MVNEGSAAAVPGSDIVQALTPMQQAHDTQGSWAVMGAFLSNRTLSAKKHDC